MGSVIRYSWIFIFILPQSALLGFLMERVLLLSKYLLIRFALLAFLANRKSLLILCKNVGGEGEKIIRTSCLTVRCTPSLPAFKLRRNCRKWKKWRLLWQGELHNLLIRLGAWPAKYRIVPNLAIMGRDAKGDYGFYRLRILEHCKKNVYTYIVLPMIVF